MPPHRHSLAALHPGSWGLAALPPPHHYAVACLVTQVLCCTASSQGQVPGVRPRVPQSKCSVKGYVNDLKKVSSGKTPVLTTPAAPTIVHGDLWKIQREEKESKGYGIPPMGQ